MAAAAKITVAGAGVLGLACAFELAQAGCEVTVHDPAEGRASAVAAGMLAPVFEAVLDPLAAGHFDLLLAARDLWPDLEARAGLHVDRSGAMAAGAADWLAGLDAAINRLGTRAVDLPMAAARAMAPGLSSGVEGALLTREDWRIDAGPALAALRRAVERAGGRFSAEPVRDRGGADLLVIATGAGRDLADLAPELAMLEPVKGHIIRIRTDEAPAVVVRGQGAYAAPVAGGLLVGATMEPGVADPAVDPAKAEPVLLAGVQLFPAIAGAPREVMAGVRGATPDGLPLVGQGVAPGVLIAAGARRNGWLLAPLIARIIAAEVMGRDTGAFAARMDPRRFTQAA